MNKFLRRQLILILSVLVIILIGGLLTFDYHENMTMGSWALILIVEFLIQLLVHYIQERPMP